ncbi:Helicase protein MOM1 [Spatholobus suberectus]|nr:Helicase protein MOM1 [Spatholobus suberectus]
MVNGTRSSHRAKDENNNNGRMMQNGEKGKIKSRPNVSDATGLRRSPRETSSKKIIPSPSSTSKSGRLEKRAPPTPAVNRKSERVEKKEMPSPLRRSERTRSHSSASASDSKSSGSSSSAHKPKKEKSVRQLTLEAKEVNENEEHDLGTPQVKVKRMTARMYRSLFELPKEESKRINKSNQEGGNNSGGKIDECSKGSHSDCKEVFKNGTLPSEDGKSKEMRVDSGLGGPVKDLVENTVTLGSLAPSNAATYETGLASESIQPDYCREETSQMLVSSNSILGEDLIRNSVGDDRGEKLIPSTRKGITMDVDSDVSVRLANGDNCNLIPDGSPSRLGGNIMGTDRPSNVAIYETGLVPERVQPDCCREETLQMLPSSNSIVDEELIRNSVGHDGSGEKLVPSKRKGITVDMDSDVPATLAKGDNCNLIPDGSSPSRLGGNIMGTDRPSNVAIYETGLVPERVQPDCCREEPLQMLLTSNSILDEDLIKNSVGHDNSGEKLVPSKRKGITVDMDSDVSATLAKGDNCNLIPDGSSPSKLGGNIMGTERPSNAAIYETGLVPERIQPDCCREETLQMLPKSNSILDEDLIRNSDGHDSSGEKLVSSKRKGTTVDMDSDVSATLAKGDSCNLIPGGNIPSRLDGNIMGTDGSCSKRIRLDYNPTVTESCVPSATELQDGDYIDASMLQKDSQIDNEEEAGLITNSNSSVIQLKERLASHIAYRCKSDSFRFVEYWVPVQISNVQLEQYCDILLSNASILRSSSKADSVEAVRDVLISTRKCCSLPYLVDPKLKQSLNEGLKPIEYLDVEIKSSGKLQLLDSMLEELKKNALRVLILFQSIGGSGRISIGDYLEDLLQQRFGTDLYERIDKGLSSSKKQAAMKKFNDKNNRRFVFLLETCACLPSIKLSSVDTIIIFDSDWNPVNDIRSLQKITLDSQFELIKIFRLYSSFTVEEKALILSKQYKTLDINLQNINWSTSHMLLMWGASSLFNELKAFHDGETCTSNVKSLFGQPLLKEAMHEFSSLLSLDGENIDSSNCSTLLKVQQNGVTYSANFSLLGELKFRVLHEEPPQFFWTKVLEGKQFRWKYINSSCQRSRKKVHHFDGSVNGPDLVSEGAAKKRRKVSNNIVDQPSSKSESEKLSAGIKAGTSGDLVVDRSQGNNVESEQKSRQHDEQRSLHLLLKPEITKLCDVLLLPDNVKSMIDNFLDYVMSNHHVNREPLSILQAFQMSLCWTAASLLKHKLDHKDSLTHAEKNLKFECKKEEVDYIYSMLRCLKKIFLYRTGNYNDTSSPKASEPSNRAFSYAGVAREVELFKKDMSKSIKEIRKKCETQLKKLRLLQEEEKQRLRAANEKGKAKFEGRYKIQSAVIRSCSPNDVVRMEKLRVLNIQYEKEIEELKCKHETCLKDLEDKQVAQIQKFQEREATWVEDVESWAQKELLNIVASKELGTGVESLQSCDQVQPHNDLKNHFAEGKGHDNRVEAMTETVTENSPLCDKRIASMATVSLLDREELLGLHGTVNVTDCPENSTAVNPTSSTEQKSDGGAVNELSNGPDNNTLLSPRHQNSDGVPSSILDGHTQVEVQETSNEVDTVSLTKRQVPVETPGMVSFTGCPQNASDRGPLDVTGLDRVLSPRPCQTASSSDEVVTISISNPLLAQQTTDGVPCSIPAAADCCDDIEHLTNAVLVDKRTTSDQQEEAPKTMTELSQETPVSRSVNVMDPPDQVQQLSVESSPDHDTSGEMQHSSKQPELVSSAVDVPANQSNQVSLIMKPLERVQQLPPAELPSSHLDSTNFPLATEVEHQPTAVPNQGHAT